MKRCSGREQERKMPRRDRPQQIRGVLGLLAIAWGLGFAAPAAALQIVVNSAQDGPIQPDDQLTLREAIALAQGSLTLDQLSPAEAAQVDGQEVVPRARPVLKQQRIGNRRGVFSVFVAQQRIEAIVPRVAVGQT